MGANEKELEKGWIVKGAVVGRVLDVDGNTVAFIAEEGMEDTPPADVEVTVGTLTEVNGGISVAVLEIGGSQEVASVVPDKAEEWRAVDVVVEEG